MSTLTITKSNHAIKVWFDDTKFYILLGFSVINNKIINQ